MNDTTVKCHEALETIDKMHRILESVLDESCEAYFQEPLDEHTVGAAERMLEIGRLIYDSPSDFIEMVHEYIAHAVLYQGKEIWDEVEIPDDGLDISEEFRLDAFVVAESVTEKTTWEEFEATILTSLSAACNRKNPETIKI